MFEIEKYSIIDVNTSNNIREYYIKNGINATWIKESELKQKITNKALQVANAVVSSNGRVVWQDKTGVNSRIQDFMIRFLNTYSYTFNMVNSIQLVKDIYNELYTIYLEDRRTQGTKELTDHILKIIDSMCSYIRDTKYTLRLGGKLGLNVKNITHVENADKDKIYKQVEYYTKQIESKLNKDKYSDYKEIVENISKIKVITPLLRSVNKLNNDKYIEIKQCTLDLINTLKSIVDFTVFDYLSYDILEQFSIDIATEYKDSLNNNRMPVIKILTESEQEKMIRTVIAPIIKDYNSYKLKLHTKKNEINSWFKTYSSKLKILTEAFSEPINIDANSEAIYDNVLKINKNMVEKCINIVIKDSTYNSEANNFSELIEFISDTIGQSVGKIAVKGISSVFSKKKRALANKELSTFANEMIDKLDSDQTVADRLIMLYLCDRIEVEQNYNLLDILDKHRQNYKNLKKIVYKTRTYKYGTYLSLLLELMTLDSGQITLNKNSMEFSYKTEDFMKAWLIAYRTLINNVNTNIKMKSSNCDAMFWLLFEEIYHKFSINIQEYKNKDKIYYHTIMSNYNITIGTKFVSHAEAKIDISKYITT